MDSNVTAIFAAFGIVIAITTVVVVIFYLVGAIASYKYLKVRSYENSWMAFIPIVNIWALVEATYGTADTINVYGWDAPAMVLKLWSIVTYVLALIINVIPAIGSALSLLLTILNIAVLLMIYKDMMERLDNPQDGFGAIIAVVIHIIADIKIIGAAGQFSPGQQNWHEDNRVLTSQTVTDGPLSFMNKKSG